MADNNSKNIMKMINRITRECLPNKKSISFEEYQEIINKSEKLGELFEKLLSDIVVDNTVSFNKLSDETNGLIEKAKELLDIYISYKKINVTFDLDEEEKEPEEEFELSESLLEYNLELESYCDEDPVKMYMREIGKIPLLTPEEEYEIGKILKNNSIESIEYKEASKKMAESNLRLVVSIAKRYVGRGLELLDLIQAGNEGLMKAIEKFDVDKGYKFSTYATHWIRQGVTRSLSNEGRSIRLPVHIYEKVNKFKRYSTDFYNKYEREPSIEEISKHFGWKPEYALEIKKHSYDLISLEKPIGEDEHGEQAVLGDYIESPDVSVEDQAISNNTKGELIKIVESRLSGRDLDIIYMRLAINYDRVYTLEEIGAKYGVTRERIRQIESKSLRKLRNNRDIRGYMKEV